MNTLLRTTEFDRWLKGVRDRVAQARIAQRLDAAVIGHFGDCEPVGDGISEMRIHVGVGYRVYFTRRGAVVYLLICGGDKASQKRDIKRAKKLLQLLPKE
ncbi:MAG: type II toxin-antitoxin system RelE/ParE family toxin [Candidatus Acidiferrales bacterium]